MSIVNRALIVERDCAVAADLTSKEPFLNREQAAAALTKHGYKIARATLATMASRGQGPVYKKWGAQTLYRLSDLLAWAKSKTADAGGFDAVPELDEWHEWGGIRYRVSYDSAKVFIVPDEFRIKEFTAMPDGTIHVVLEKRTG
jgi:hypothetical protein